MSLGSAVAELMAFYRAHPAAWRQEGLGLRLRELGHPGVVHQPRAALDPTQPGALSAWQDSFGGDREGALAALEAAAARAPTPQGPLLFMAEQEDPELQVWLGRGFKVYDGTGG